MRVLQKSRQLLITGKGLNMGPRLGCTRPAPYLETQLMQYLCRVDTQYAQPHNAHRQVIGALVHPGAPVALLLGAQIAIKIARIGNNLPGQIQAHVTGKLLIHHARDAHVFRNRSGPEDMIDPGPGRSNALQIGKAAEYPCRWPPDKQKRNFFRRRYIRKSCYR